MRSTYVITYRWRKLKLNIYSVTKWNYSRSGEKNCARRLSYMYVVEPLNWVTDVSVDQQQNYNLPPHRYVTLNRKQLYLVRKWLSQFLIIKLYYNLRYISSTARNNAVAVVPIGCNRNARIVRSEPWIDSRTMLQRAAALISAWLRR